MLVDGQHLLTALHVLGTPVSHEGTTVVFPQTGSEFNVEIVDLAETSSADLAVLRVLDPAAGTLPKPIDVWPDDRLPDAVVVFGFPEEEEKSEGVWRQFTVLGPTVTGIRQLRWDEGKGTFPGHSGGPVTDVDTGQLVGILLAGSEKGHFDRFIAIPQIAKIWPELRRPWRYAKKNPQSHSGRRARGQKGGAQDDVFYGRTAALNAIATWLRGEPPRRPLVVVGQPGSGKSAVLARAALKAERAGGRGLVYHARGSSLDDFLDAVAGFLGLSVQEVEDLLDGAGQRDLAFTVMVDALDEAHSVRDTRSIADYITALSRLPTVHTVVATRPQAVGNRFGSGGILERLLVYEESQRSLIDLDVAPYRDGRAIQAFVGAMLAQETAAYPSPTGCAWETYRACDDLRLGLSKIIAERADPNFLVAAITSMTLSQQDQALDYRDPSFEPNSLPSSLGDALDEYFESIDAASVQQVRGLLAALAYARGSGISDDRWMTFTSALGYSASQDDIERFRDSPGADYLLQTESGDGDHTVRLFHQALLDQLRAGKPQRYEQKIYESLSEDVCNSGGWSRADAYLTTNIADHALTCGQLANLLEDCEYIAVADIAALVSALDTLDPLECSEMGHLILQEGPRLRDLGRDERLWLLAISATHAGKRAIRDKLLSARVPALFPDWAHALGSSHQKLIGHKGPVHALAIGRLGRTDVIVSGGTDKTIRVWDHRGNSLGDPLEGHNNNVTALTVGVVDGDDVIISGSADRTVRVWNQNGPVGDPFIGHTEPVSAVQIIKFEDEDAVVSAAPRGEIIVWNSEGRVLRRFILDSPLVATGVLGGKPSIVAVGYRNLSLFSPADGNLRSVPVEQTVKTALAIGRLGNSDVVVCGLEDASVVVWRADGSSARDPLLGHERPARSIAVGRLGGTDVVASGSQDNSLVIWDFRGNVLAEPWTGHAGTVNAVTTGSLKGRDVVVCAGDDRNVRVWDNRTLRSPGRTNRRGQIRALGAGMIAGSFRIATASGSGIELWGLDGKEVNEPSADHDVDIRAIAIGRLSRGDAIVSASMDRKIHIWDLKGCPSGKPIVVHGKRITALAIGRHCGQSVIASASLDKTIRVWDEDGNEVDRLAAFGKRGARALSFGRFGGRDSLIVAGSDNLVRVWDLLDRTWAHRSPGSSSRSVACVTLCTIDGCDIIAVGGSDGRIRTWQAGQKDYRVSQERHAAHINALAFLDMAGSPALVSAGADSVLRVWSDMRRSDMFPLSESATHIAIAGSRIVIASGPALSMLSYSTPSGRGSLDKSEDDSFTSTSELVVEGIADPAWVDVVAQPAKGSFRHIRYIRTLLELGDADEAVAQLLPQLAHMSDAVRLAADAAGASGQASLIETVMPYLEDAQMRSQPSVQGRLFALAVVVDRLDTALAAARAVGASLDTGAMGMIQLLDGDPEREWLVYRRSALALQDGSFDDEFTFAHYIADVAAMRLLAVCRRGAGGNLDLFVQRRDSLLEEYWGWFDDEVEERLAAMLSAYVASAEDHTRLLPYQVISVYEVLRSIVQENLGFRDQLVETLTQSLRPERSKVRSDFAAWAVYSDLVAAVVKRLAELDAAR